MTARESGDGAERRLSRLSSPLSLHPSFLCSSEWQSWSERGERNADWHWGVFAGACGTSWSILEGVSMDDASRNLFHRKASSQIIWIAVQGFKTKRVLFIRKMFPAPDGYFTAEHFVSSYPHLKVIDSLITNFFSLLVELDELESDKKKKKKSKHARHSLYGISIYFTENNVAPARVPAGREKRFARRFRGRREGRSSEMDWNVKGCKTLTGVGGWGVGAVRIGKEDREDGLNWSGENKCQEDGGDLGGRRMEGTGKLSWKQQTWRNGKTDRCRCDGREWGGWRKESDCLTSS